MKYHTSREFTFVQPFTFLRSYFANLGSLPASPAKGKREEDLWKINTQNRALEKTKDTSLFQLKCLCYH